MDEKKFWLGFSAFPGVGPTRFNLLLSHFGTAKDAWSASQTDLNKVLGIALSVKFVDFRNNFPLQSYGKDMQQKGVTFVTLSDKNYPELLRQIKNPPFVLYIKGNDNFSDSLPVAVVGTRRITQYGMQVTRTLVSELAQAGFVIVSGLAMGVDSVAHMATVNEGGKTIAVLGCGVDCCTPVINQPIYESILQNGGTIVSEFPIGAASTKGSFPSRNRIIAGLSLGVIVTEGAEDSGALITAKDAFANGRKVFAVPGPITSDLSKGPYDLIKKGAILVTSGKEILEELNLKSNKSTRSTKSIKGETKEEQVIIDILRNESLHFDTLVKRTKMSSSDLGSLLSLLEMKGIVQSLDNGFFAIKNL